jgi:hypothetical protein
MGERGRKHLKDQQHQLERGRQEPWSKKRHQIGNYRFSCGEVMLIGINFHLMQNMIMNNISKQLTYSMKLNTTQEATRYEATH